MPLQNTINNSTSTGIAFGNAALVMLSLAPKGMEDIPQIVRNELESFGIGLGFSDVLVVDCHNAMGKHLDDSDRNDLVIAAKQCLAQLKNQRQQEFKIGFASTNAISQMPELADELGQAGLAVLTISVNGKDYAIGWADSNNMENSLRNHIISRLTRSVTLLELCSSDTHSTSGKRTREVYFPLGTTSSSDRISEMFNQLSIKAAESATGTTFELASAQSRVKVMGKKQFEDYSTALDRSMSVTKIFVAITVAIYIAMLVLS
jgi:putative membrane protein